MNTLNLNVDQQTLEMCIKEISNIGSTQYQNICTGENAVVAWGGVDWIIYCAIFVPIALLSIIGTLAIIIVCYNSVVDVIRRRL